MVPKVVGSSPIIRPNFFQMKNPIKYLRYRYYKHKGFSHYHARIAADFWWTQRRSMRRKRQEIIYYLQSKKPVRANIDTIAVLGCAHKYYAKHYEVFFKQLFNKDISVVTYDLTTTHLNGTSVVEHDCTKPLPKKADFIYSHMTINFIAPKKQKTFLESCAKSLTDRGIALHFYTHPRSGQKKYVQNAFHSVRPKLLDNTSSGQRLARSLFW